MCQLHPEAYSQAAMLGPKPAQTSGCPRLAVRTCFQDISLALPLSVSWFCLHPSPENRQQSSAGVGSTWGLIVLLGHILVSSPLKRNLFFPRPPGTKSHETSLQKGWSDILLNSREQRGFGVGGIHQYSL